MFDIVNKIQRVIILNRKTLVAIITILGTLAGGLAIAIWTGTGGYVSYEVPETGEPVVVPFNLDLGTLQKGTNGGASTNFILNTTNVGERAVYTFKMVNTSTLAQTFSRFTMILWVNGTQHTIAYDPSEPVETCFTQELYPGEYVIEVSIDYFVLYDAESTTVENLAILQIELGDNC